MATSLNAGYSNNINVLQVRVNGAHSQRLTDRALTSPVAAARTVISETTETDGGVTKDEGQEFTEGAN
jgi:hypothetical protein